jgi:hypothetical protein
LIATKPEPAKKPIVERGTLVRVEVAQLSDQTLRLRAQGSVTPARRVVLQSEVAGRVVWQSPELVPGGRLTKGKTALRIDRRDYQLALEQQAAAVERAALEVKVEASRRAVAAREWQIMGEDDNATEEGRTLALRGPQLETAEASLDAARSSRRVAQLAVSKTEITVPFNAFVQQESVDVGQLVTPQMPLATLVGTDAVWVQVSLPMDHLSAFDVPGFNCADGKGSVARVSQDLGGQAVERQGRVIRLLGDLDPIGRLARVLVEIRRPFDTGPLDTGPLDTGPAADGERPAQLPLLVGAYVNVELEGHVARGVVELPRRALREGDQVYVVGAEDRLEIRKVSLAWKRADSVLVSQGVIAGDRVIVGRVIAPVVGMSLRVAAPPTSRALGPATSADEGSVQAVQ